MQMVTASVGAGLGLPTSNYSYNGTFLEHASLELHLAVEVKTAPTTPTHTHPHPPYPYTPIHTGPHRRAQQRPQRRHTRPPAQRRLHLCAASARALELTSSRRRGCCVDVLSFHWPATGLPLACHCHCLSTTVL